MVPNTPYHRLCSMYFIWNIIYGSVVYQVTAPIAGVMFYKSFRVFFAMLCGICSVPECFTRSCNRNLCFLRTATIHTDFTIRHDVSCCMETWERKANSPPFCGTLHSSKPCPQIVPYVPENVPHKTYQKVRKETNNSHGGKLCLFYYNRPHCIFS